MPMLWSGSAFASDSRSVHTRQRLRPQPPQAVGGQGQDNATRKEMPSEQDNPTPVVKRCSFEPWDLAEPIRAAPSILYALTPRGLGTPFVESLSSYIGRLAEAHVVSVWRLILHVRSQVCSDRLSRSEERRVGKECRSRW